jgi:hypothetical protein
MWVFPLCALPSDYHVQSIVLFLLLVFYLIICVAWIVTFSYVLLINFKSVLWSLLRKCFGRVPNFLNTCSMYVRESLLCYKLYLYCGPCLGILLNVPNFLNSCSVFVLGWLFDKCFDCVPNFLNHCSISVLGPCFGWLCSKLLLECLFHICTGVLVWE